MTNTEIGAANLEAPTSKLVYQRPSLTVYGSVRELTGGSSGQAADGNIKSPPNKPAQSDPATKENAVQIGTHPAGFGLYLFDYKAEHRDAHGHGRQFGVMANEVEAIMPEAVVVQDNGYRAVRYDLLGITRH